MSEYIIPKSLLKNNLYIIPVGQLCQQYMDYASVRNGDLPPAKSVGVNHRALITRALTKYPVDYALFRELLQNSADAHASRATIRFEPMDTAEPNLRSIHTTPIGRLEFTNDGDVFTDDDWKRLREIASGNPNETKIGAFGVGFYSTFEISDKPLVHSGNQIMTFRFQGDELMYQQVEASEYVKGTIIDLPYKSPGKVPDLVKFSSFLSQSFTLVPLDQVELFIEDTRLLRLQKLCSPPQLLSIDSSVSNSSPSGQLALKKLMLTPLQITLQYLNVTQMPPVTMQNGFLNFGRQLVQSLATASQDPAEETTVITFLRRIDAIVDVRVSSGFRQKMIDTVLKPPPRQTTMSLLTQTHHEHEVSQLKPPLSEYIFPTNFNDAKIFIGFPTRQSTSIKSHVALNQAIPTLERTAVDMSNDLVKDWNCQILYMAGVLARCVYESEMRACHNLDDAQYILNRFQMGESAPDAIIGRWVASGFWRCSQVIYLPTANHGILPSDKIRWPGDAADLIRSTPIILPQKGLETIYESLRELGYVREISVKEIAADVSQSPLNPSHFCSLVKWAIKHNTFSVMSQAIVTLDEEFWYLGNVESYQVDTIVPEGYPLPANCLTQRFIKACSKLSTTDLDKIGLHALSIVEWVRFLVGEASNPEKSVVTDENLANRFLGVLSGKWYTISNGDRGQIIQLLQSVPLIPTQLGMMYPQQSYLKEVPLCSHIPIISDKVTTSKDFLRDIGLRESMDMRYVLQNLHDSQLRWSTPDLIDYLIANASSLKQSDWKTLQEGQFFQKKDSKGLYRARDLFQPDEDLRSMGFPVINVDEKPTGSSFKILRRLGLKIYPTIEDLFSRDTTKALNYYLKNAEEASYSSKSLCNYRIIPCNDGKLYKPQECFSDQQLKVFGLPVVTSEYADHSSRLGIRKTPPISWLLKRVINDPLKDWNIANEIFSYLSSHLSDLSRADIAACRRTPFLPGGLKPIDVFMPDGESSSGFEKLFPIITPTSSAIPFLRHVGVLRSPTLLQIVRKTVFEPQAVMEILGGPSRYISLLARIESEWQDISQDDGLVKDMKQQKWLLGLKNDETSSLFFSNEVAIVDDVIIYDQFKDKIITAPQETLVEQLYANLGVPRLSHMLKQQVQIGRSILAKDLSLEDHIRQRLSLFLDTTTKERLLKASDVDSLKVEFVDKIKLIRQLGNSPRIEVPTTAWIRERLMLLVTENYQWIDISRALVKACLRKPDPDAVIVLELQLSASLEALRLKGYNVNRFHKDRAPLELNFTPTTPPPKPEDARVPPLKTNGTKEVAQDYQRHPKPQQKPNPVASLPGSLPGSLPYPPQPVSEPPESTSVKGEKNGLFGGLPQIISKSLTGSYPRPHDQSRAAGNPLPLDTSLDAGIDASRTYQGNSLSAPKNVDSPTPISLDQECQSTRIYDLKRMTLLPGGPVIYAAKNWEEPPTASLMCAADAFKVILLKLQSIYRFPWASLAIYCDSDTSTIAFNYNGSIFVNLIVFIQKFYSSNLWSPSSALDYWFVVLAHELAHNLVSVHGAKHSFFSEAYIQKYLTVRRQHMVPDSAKVNHA